MLGHRYLRFLILIKRRLFIMDWCVFIISYLMIINTRFIWTPIFYFFICKSHVVTLIFCQHCQNSKYKTEYILERRYLQLIDNNCMPFTEYNSEIQSCPIITRLRRGNRKIRVILPYIFYDYLLFDFKLPQANNVKNCFRNFFIERLEFWVFFFFLST